MTPLAISLNRHGFGLTYWDLTESDYVLAKRRQSFLPEHRRQFEGEGIGFICENRLGDATDIMRAIEAGKHKRYLYRALLA